MPLSFVESMQGTLTHSSGEVYPIDFHIRTSSEGRGRFGITGVIHAIPWATEASCRGTLTIGVVPSSIAYDVRFRGADGIDYVLTGAKSPKLLRPLSTMTTLPVTLQGADGHVVGTGLMRFALADLPGFLLSWLQLPTPATRRFDANRRAVARRELVQGH